LGEQALGIDLGLRQQQPKADILRRQKVVWGRSADAQMVLALVTFDFKHRQLYHHKSGPAHIYYRRGSRDIAHSGLSMLQSGEYCRFWHANAVSQA